jgi:hypothetical protein
MFSGDIESEIFPFVGQAFITQKDKRNVPTVKVGKFSNMQIFLTSKNIEFVSRKAYTAHIFSGGQETFETIKSKVKTLMPLWATDVNLDSYAPTVKWTTREALIAFNDMFIEDHKAEFEVESKDNSKFVDPILKKKPEDYLADDYGKLRFPMPRPLYITDMQQRYKNAIPVWQLALTKRHFDRTQESFPIEDPMRASLVNPVRGYDMSKAYETIDKYLPDNRGKVPFPSEGY